MCGIIGYKGPNNAVQIINEGLKKLEYRGYDSWGISCVGDSVIQTEKKVGRVGQSNLGESHAGIGHTRWATHGGVLERNAHPHTSCDKKVAVVHNGIIENYGELKKFLVSRDHSFSSDTDSEVIAHLIEEYCKTKVFKNAVRETANKLKGSFAFVAIHNESRKIIGVKKDSPLVIGVGDNESFIASDVTAFLNHTKKVVFMNDYDMVILNGGVNFYDFRTGEEIQKETEEIQWDYEQATKGDYEHYMMKEIAEQHETILKSIHPKEDILEAANEINNAFGVFFVACGSSYNAALTASYIFSKVAKKHINVVLGSEFQYYKDFLTDRTLVIPISQSGETADVLEAIKIAKEKGSKVMSIVNVMGSTIMRKSDKSILLNAGPEICVLSTKSYTSQLSVLIQLAYACAGRLDEAREKLKRYSEETKDITSPETRIKLVELASKLHEEENLYVIGRGTSYPNALEAALKIKEVSYVHAEGFAGGELKHGTLALIEKNTPCIVFAPDNETYDDIISNATEIKSRGGYIIGVGPKNNDVFDYFIKVKANNPLLNIIPVQILAYYLAVMRNCDPDKPRNLAKSVTVK